VEFDSLDRMNAGSKIGKCLRAGTHKRDSHRQRNLIQDPREEIMHGSGILVERRAV